MNNFQLATRKKVRYQTSNGSISVEQLWDISLTKLSTIIKTLNTSLVRDNPDELSFLDETTEKVDELKQLLFDVAKEIYIIRRNEAKELREDKDIKEHNEKILALIVEKQNSKLGDMTEEELRKMLK
jgi:hypothetical protein